MPRSNNQPLIFKTYGGDAFAVSKILDPVALLEGHRAVPARDIPVLMEMGRIPPRVLSSARFSIGNVPGSDTFFVERMVFVDSSRMEYVVPYG